MTRTIGSLSGQHAERDSIEMHAIALTYDVSTHTQPLAGVSATPRRESFKLVATLDRDRLAIEHHDHRHVYDFELRRQAEIDLRSNTVHWYSLFAEVDYRSAESKNCLYIGEVAAAGGVPDGFMAPALVEHFFGLAAAKGGTKVDRAREGSDDVFVWNGHELMAVSTDTEPLPSDFQAAYWRFLRYYARGHPAIYQALTGQTGAAARIRVVLSHMETETRTLRLLRAAPAASVPAAPTDAQVADKTRNEPYATLIRIGSDGPAELERRASALCAVRDAAVVTRRKLWGRKNLDAMLASLERGFMTGDNDAAWMQSHRRALDADREVRRLMKAVSPSSRKDAQQAIRTFDALKRRDPDARYVLDVLAGSMLLQLGEPAEAIDRLLSVLRRNPLLVGPWIDLGRAYRARYDMPAAWTCWDAARALNPDHPFRSVPGEIEQRLLHEHPEFF